MTDERKRLYTGYATPEHRQRGLSRVYLGSAPRQETNRADAKLRKFSWEKEAEEKY